MMVVAIAMSGSLTVLPALLGKLGDRVEKGRIPFLHRLRSKNGESRVRGGILDRVLRRPVFSAVAAGAVLIALTVPALSLNTATTGVDGISIAEVEPQQALASGQMRGPIEVEASRDRTGAQVSIPLAGTSTDAASQAAPRHPAR
jgi:uncharacterized membrane protein YdfJ with MMPL/SSD domain